MDEISTNEASLLDFPEEVLVTIISYLSPSTCCKLLLVCKYFERLVRDPLRWKLLIRDPDVEGAPEPRLWCSSAVVGDKFFLYGGHVTEKGTNLIESVKSDLYVYNLVSRTWTRVDHKLGKKTELKCFVYKNNLWFLGGYNASIYTNEVCRYDLETGESFKVQCAGTPFSPRSAMTTVVYRQNAYVFGGWSGFEGVWFNDLYKLDLDTLTWECVSTTGTAPARTSHVAVLHKNCMYIFAGYSGQTYLNDLHQLNLDTNTWTEIKCSGQIPEPRSRFCAAVHNNTMYCLGGWNKAQHFPDLYAFDFDTRVWTKVTPAEGCEFPPLSQYSLGIWHSKTQRNPLGGRDFLMIFGGFDTRVGRPVNRLYRYALPPVDSDDESLIDDDTNNLLPNYEVLSLNDEQPKGAE
eukprot:TRINITY_DN2674_c0_g1_i1.p1 TRINITY_DN2674_c0_g1~~TRINITY_DN2674_c0_g1_i1.p1  ORF type:complete len:405 (+),score=24.63 TRINITY_DN2674_c0_g1_i1:293-1507(+)